MSTTPQVQPPTSSSARGAHGQRRTHRPRRPPNNEAPGPGRRFGGQLTRINPEAPAFTPSSIPPLQPQTSTRAPSIASSSEPVSKTSQQQRPQRRRRSSLLRSTAPDIATRTHDDIGHGIYECAICTNEISRRSRVWGCHTCWTVFHVGCIKTWSKNEGAAVQRQNPTDGEPDQAKQWRCPGCNLPKDTLPTSYTCWCEKEINPKLIGGLPPHSCGQTCGRKRTFPKPCPHPCDLICHAGPCPPCTSIGPEQMCFCGNESTSKKCTETDYDMGWSCGRICGEMMPCGNHTCPQSCHEGLCGACEVAVGARCYCGKEEKQIPCSDFGEEKPSFDWTGTFSCHQPCSRAFDCGKHSCQKSCHPQDEEMPHCSRAPDVVATCPCGKTVLAELTPSVRSSCEDPIPHCEQLCGKLLKCGHECDQPCHTGECSPCFRKVGVSCRCGRNNFEVVCQSSTDEEPQCTRTCRITLSCGRHECGERCCTGERQGAERQATRRKLRSLRSLTTAVDGDIEPEHICPRTCGRALKCGNHTCPELCHKGPCLSCKEAIFDDLACHCGKTVLQAPIPCGTSPPPCNFPCQRSKSCNHPNAHPCHSDDQACPKCPYLTEKTCLCSKKVLKNQPCGRVDVFCGLVCGKTLKCGSHTCQKLCHRPGECEDDVVSCQQICGKSKKTCGHPCERTCHAPSICKEDQYCSSKIMVTCECQRKKEEVRCNARAGVPIPPNRQISLKCDDECARLERNRKLALALHISDEHTDEHVPYSTETLKLYIDDVAWANKQEEAFRLFAADEDEKRLRYQPMKSHQRAFIHSLAEDFGFDSESLDPEPHRHVLVFKTPKFVAAPMKTLAQAARLRRAELAVSAPIAPAPIKKPEVVKHHSYNAFLLLKPKFALTEDELRPHLESAAAHIHFHIHFIPSDDTIILVATLSDAHQLPTPADRLTATLRQAQQTLAFELTKSGLAASLKLCKVDPTDSIPELLYDEIEQSTSAATGGWSKVAARRAVPMQAQLAKPVGQRPVYTVLGSRLAEARRVKEENEGKLRVTAKGRKEKKVEEEVVDDWEQVVDAED